MSRYHDIPPRSRPSGPVNVVIDTPKGSRNKYKFDEQARCFRLSRILPVGAWFPFDFGSIPQTRAPDGDPLDVLVVMDEPTFPGCLLSVKLIGVLAAWQLEKGRGIRNDRLLGVPQTPVNPPRIHDLKGLGPGMLEEIEHFFVAYNAAQGRRFEILRRQGPGAAQRILARSIHAFRRRESADR